MAEEDELKQIEVRQQKLMQAFRMFPYEGFQRDIADATPADLEVMIGWCDQQLDKLLNMLWPGPDPGEAHLRYNHLRGVLVNRLANRKALKQAHVDRWEEYGRYFGLIGMLTGIAGLVISLIALLR